MARTSDKVSMLDVYKLVDDKCKGLEDQVSELKVQVSSLKAQMVLFATLIPAAIGMFGIFVSVIINKK